jgi:urease accessory protein
MQGSLSLTLAKRDGRTRATRVVASPPLQCSRARYDDADRPGAASLTLLHLGGVLQGDQLDLAIALEPGAEARIGTAAATQVYRMPEREASQTTSIALQARARLQYLPEPTILFAGARFSQATRITLHPGAALTLHELLVCGRVARGELHQYERYRARFEVCDAAGRCLLSERALLEPARFSPASLGSQAAYPVVGSLYALALGADVERQLAGVALALEPHRDVLAEAGALPNGCGVLVRALGDTAQGVRVALDAARQHLSSTAGCDIS